MTEPAPAGPRASRGSPPPLPYRIVDAFTGRPFSGNPAAVVLPPPAREGEKAPNDAAARGDAFLQAVAAEMNLSETAFPSDPGADGVRRLRWFTPTTEVTLCGHATLAAAHALLEEAEASGEGGGLLPLRFASLSGALTVHGEEDGRLRLDFPADPPVRMQPPSGLTEALGLPGEAAFHSGARCALVEVASEEVLASLRPAMEALGRVRLGPGVMGVCVTAPGGEPGVDFASRFFGPWVGVPEDPVTGMAHTVLGPFWAQRLGRSELEARQRSRRGGALTVRVAAGRVHLVGRAVTVARGELLAG